MNTYSPYLEILNEGKGRRTEGNISPPFLPFPSFLFNPKKEGKERFLIVLLHSPPSFLTTYPNKVSTNHLPVLPFPSITFPSLPLPFPSLSQSK